MTSNDARAQAVERRAIVTGAAGFVGSTLCKYLRAHGWDVVRAVSTGQAEGIICDITRRAEVEHLLETAGDVSHIFHLAAVAFVPAAAKDPINAVEVNLNGTIHFLHALQQRGYTGRFIYIGSADAYGPPLAVPVTEEQPLCPVNPYAITKAAADAHCAYFSRSTSLDIVRMRPFNHSGAGQSSDLFLSSVARQVAEIEAGLKPPLMKIGNLDVRRDFSHVDDVVHAFELAALKGRRGEAYNVCSGRTVLLRDALQTVLDESEVEITVEQDPARMRAVDVVEIKGSYEKLHRDTGWQPVRPFGDIIHDLLVYWRKEVGATKAQQ